MDQLSGTLKMKRKSITIKHAITKDMLKRITTTLLISTCLLLISTMQTATAQTHGDDELLLKAAYIYNFAIFTRWPESTWKTKDMPLKLCIAGKDALSDEIQKLHAKIIKGRPVTIHPLKNAQTAKDCQILYIATSEGKNYKDILKSVHDEPVLTISELPYFARSKGIIELYRAKDQTFFIITLEASNKAGLEFSSRLLSLAVVIPEEGAE